MPRWDYECVKCTLQYEIEYDSIADRDKKENKVKCPACKSIRKNRLISKPSFILKGKWFKQGY